MKSKKIVFLIRDLNHGGAAKMLAYFANIATEVFSEVIIVVIGSVTNSSLGLKKEIRVEILENLGMTINRTSRIFREIRQIRRKIDFLNPDVLMPFVSGNVVYAYLAVRNRYYMVGAERGNPEALPLKLKMLCKYIYTKCNYMLFQSQGAADFYFKGKRKRYEIIPNPCILPSIKREQKNKRIIKIVSSSRLSKEKNLDILLEAFPKCKVCKQAELFIYGEGCEEESLKRQTHELDLDKKVHFWGKVDNVSEQIKDADIFVLVSSSEGMPNGLIEAMALGLPCITTNCMANNTNSLVENEINGIIVKKRNADELAMAIDRLIFDKELADKISENAIKIRDELSEKYVNQRTYNFFEKILKDLEAD